MAKRLPDDALLDELTSAVEQLLGGEGSVEGVEEVVRELGHGAHAVRDLGSRLLASSDPAHAALGLRMVANFAADTTRLRVFERASHDPARDISREVVERIVAAPLDDREKASELWEVARAGTDLSPAEPWITSLDIADGGTDVHRLLGILACARGDLGTLGALPLSAEDLHDILDAKRNLKLSGTLSAFLRERGLAWLHACLLLEGSPSWREKARTRSRRSESLTAVKECPRVRWFETSGRKEEKHPRTLQLSDDKRGFLRHPIRMIRSMACSRVMAIVLLMASACSTSEPPASDDASVQDTRVADTESRNDVGGDAAPNMDAGDEDAGDANVPDATVEDMTEPDSAVACFVCGDDICSAGESCATCARDCGECPCGDGVCDRGETCGTCPADCGGACPCGDGVCDSSHGETCASCAADCTCDCNDGTCSPEEYLVCEAGVSDCGFVDFCGDTICDEAEFENELNCPADCRCRDEI